MLCSQHHTIQQRRTCPSHDQAGRVKSNRSILEWQEAQLFIGNDQHDEGIAWLCKERAPRLMKPLTRPCTEYREPWTEIRLHSAAWI